MKSLFHDDVVSAGTPIVGHEQLVELRIFVFIVG